MRPSRVSGRYWRRLQRVAYEGLWDPLLVRRRVAEQMCEATRPEVWVVDDVAFPKCRTACARAPAVLRRVGQAGELTGRGQRARGQRRRLPAWGMGGG
ncbi:transposase [Streptomyces sp. NPDC002769]|uniref:transposase n=1 Tax=Streptomyces sp. NPDC002769 TaxID=3154542 RepID=UPI00331B802D